MWRNAVSIGFVLCSAAFLIRSFSVAEANDINLEARLSLGNLPYQSFAGSFSNQSPNEIIDLLTVPNGQDFMISTVLCNHDCDVLVDGVLVVDGASRVTDHNYSRGIFVAGKGHLVVPGGSTVSIQKDTSSNIHYYVDGQYIRSGGPWKSFSGSTQGSQSQTLLSLANDEAFVITAFISSGTDLDIYEDNSIRYDSRAYGAYSGMCNAHCQGNVHIPISSGTQLQLKGGSSQHYYLEGFYAKP